VRKIFRAYERHAADWDAEFQRVRDRFADRLQCGRGCSMCCSQMFSISPLEAAVIVRAVASMPEPDRERLRDAARAYLTKAAQLGLVDDAGGAESVSPRTGERLPCPALQSDICSIYSARPLICRKWGIPVYDPSKPDRLHACELNFHAGEVIEAGDLVSQQTMLLGRWVALKEEAQEQLRTPRRPVTVAEAILADPATNHESDAAP
jgi:Fe-S-cluster containining protein